MGNREEDILPGKKLILQVILGAVKGLVFSFLLVVVYALAAAGGVLPTDKALAAAMTCALIGVFTGSFFTVRKHKGKRWLLGLAVGFCVFAILFVLGLFFSLPQTGVPQIMSVTLLAGLLGGIPAPRRKHKKR